MIVSIMAGVLATHIKTSPVIRTFLNGLLEDASVDYCPKADVNELLQFLVIRKGNIPMGDPALNHRFMTNLIQPATNFWRDKMLDVLTDTDDLVPDESIVFDGFGKLANAVDALYLAWYRDVAAPYQTLSEADKKARGEFLEKALPKYDYTVFRIEDGQIVDRKPWIEAYPDIIGRIVDLLTEMYKQVTDSNLKNYLDTLIEAYSEREIGKLEDRWEAVDKAWLKRPGCRVSLTQGIEVYDSPVCVAPECRLDIPVPSDEKMIHDLQDMIISRAIDLGLDPAQETNIRHKYAVINTGLYACVSGAGWGLWFGYAGQQGPNREAVQLIGSLSFVECANTAETMTLYRTLAIRHCTPGTTVIISPRLTVENFLQFVWGHELSHPVGKTKEISDSIGAEGMKLLEEGKASILGTLANALYKKNDPEYLLGMVALWVTRIIRFTQRSEMGNSTVAPYVRESLAALTCLKRAGVIQLTDKGIKVDVDAVYSDSWLAEMRLFVTYVLIAYSEHNKGSLEALTATFCDNEHTREVIAWVNRPV